jgi:REP element-mobilizing transposase RayT
VQQAAGGDAIYGSRGYRRTVARPLRIEVPDGIYHLTARGSERAAIFRDDTDRRVFLELVADLRERYFWRVLVYCLMGNHYHLLAQTPAPNLAQGMRQLNGVYAQAFNRRHDRAGHLLEGRYSSRLVQADEHLLAATRYIVRNPVRAGFCREAGEWHWSSHRATLGLAPPRFLDVAALLSYYAPTQGIARKRYRAHVEEADSEPSAHPLVDGDEAFVVDALEHLEPTPGIPRRYLRLPVPALSELLAASDDDVAIARASGHGYSTRQIGGYLGIDASTVSRRLKRHRTHTRTATNGT